MPRTKPARKLAARRLFTAARRAETQYAVKLRKIAAHVGTIVRAFDPITQTADIVKALQAYAGVLDGWANATAARMLADVQARDDQTWTKIAREMGHSLRAEIAEAPTGQVMQRLQAEQVALIKSLPLEAAERVHNLAQESLTTGRRAEDIVELIQQSGQVSKARANVIARTETSRAGANLLQARAAHIGSEGYIWRTAEDALVRPSHKKMNGRFVRWDQPPTLDNLTGHAGCLPNCRCYAEPILPDPQ